MTSTATPHRCPVCNGQGYVARPPHIAGDQQEWVDTSAGPWPCRACLATGLIWSNQRPLYDIEIKVQP